MAQHVSNKVQEILNAYWNEALPVNVEHIAHLIGVNVMYEPILDGKPNLSGMFQYDKQNMPTCFVRSGDSYTRRRFTLAHELGHFLLAHQSTEGQLFRDDNDTLSGSRENWQETEANQFAAELLMPEFRIHSLIRNTSQTLGSLAQTFGVSENAMTRRLRNLGYSI